MNLPRTLLRAMLGRRFPRTSGTLTVAGAQQPITVARDRWGIPHITAGTDHDAWFGLGFCQAQDRAFQLEMILRISRGMLAELVGPRGLPVDRLSRRIGFVRAALLQWPALAAPVREQLTAFAAGITAGLTTGRTARPHELVLLRGTQTPWTAIDVLAFVKLQSFLLPSNWDAELARLQVLLQDGESALRDLDPSVRSLTEEFAALRSILPAGGGSNNWAIAPHRTATGRPIVANDPHLFPALPSQWYLAHLMTPEWSVAGGTFAGSPGFAAGFNGHVAWSTTAGLIDNSDLYLEQIDATGRVRDGEDWVPTPVHREEIRVRGRAAPLIEEVRVTPRGPIISPALQGEWPVLALRAVWLEPLPVRGFLDAVRARSGEEFRRCFAEWPALPLNLVFADTAGAIGYQMAGQAPRRRSHRGLLPMPGWDPAYAWEGYIPFDEMPRRDSPTADFDASANAAPPGHERDSPLGHGWLDPYRLHAIHEALSARDGWTVADCQRLQLDVRCLPWREVRTIVLGAAECRPSLRDVAELLRAWDGNVTADSRAAALFEVLAATLIVRIAQVRAPLGHEWILGKTAWMPGVNLFYLKRMGPLVEVLREQPAGWFDQPWPDVIADAIEAARAVCRDRPWGTLHRVRPKSMLLGDVPVLGRAFSLGPVPVAGDTDTISQTSVRPTSPIGEADNIAGMRMVVDVGAWSASRFCLAGGQSGNPLSPHYGDQFPLWQRGEGVPMPWTIEEVSAATELSLLLNPA